MVAAFSTPILSVAADAVRDLEGHDALSSLWTVFTKCKESLPNGARLENFTWRLWHRELKSSFLEQVSENDAAEASGLREKTSYGPPTPSALWSVVPGSSSNDAVLSFSEVPSPPSYSLSPPPCCPVRPLSEHATRLPSSRRSGSTSPRVGQIICDFLLSSTLHPSLTDTTDVPSGSFQSSATRYQSNHKPGVVAGDAMCHSALGLPEALVSLPTPESELSITGIAPQSPLPLLNPAMAHSTSGPLSQPPMLVVVNPTPNPTPKPTPPATPLVTPAASAMQGDRSHWLTPPRQTRGSAPPTVIEITNVVRVPFACDAQDASSITSSSEWSHTTTSVTGASLTSASSSSYLHDEGEKASNLIGTTTRYTHVVGNLPLATLQGLGSLSTVQSLSTDRGRKGALVGDAVKESTSGIGTGADDEERLTEQELMRKGPSEIRPAFPSNKQPRKSDSRVLLTTNVTDLTTTHVDQSLHHSPSIPLSTELPTNPESASQTNSAMNPENDLNSSQSRSRDGSSLKGSRSRSRERSGNPFADLSGIGTLGGYTIAAAYPPPNMTVRKQVVVGAAKGKVKVAFGRGHNKPKAVRRNSAGSALDVGTKEKEKGGGHGSGAKPEGVKSVEHQPNRLEDILEKSTLGEKCIESPQQQSQVLTLIHEEKGLEDSTSTAAPNQQDLAAVPKRHTDLLTTGDPIQSVKRQARFNIGSNSDDGSGIGSKSAGSGSSFSGGHSLAQRAGKMMEDSKGHKEGPHVMSERLDALLLEAQERQRRMDGAQGDVQRPAVPHHEPPAHLESKPLVTSRKLAKQESQQSEATQDAHNITHSDLERTRSSGRVSEKAKRWGKAVDHHHAVPASTSKQSSKTKSKSTPNLGSLDRLLAAKVRDSLGEPLLPKGRPVVVDSDSEYETDTEGSWSDAEVVDESEVQKQDQIRQELALQQERERQEAERQQQELLLHQMYLQNQHQHHQHVGRPAGVQRTHSSHYPAPNNARTNRGFAHRSRHQQVKELALHHAKLEQAAKEAQRQRDMVKKLPRESFQDLAKARANSVGLLTQLFKPPDNLPPNPYKRGFSSDAIQPMGLAAMQPATSDPGPYANPNTKTAEELSPINDRRHSSPAPQIPPTRPIPRRHMSTDERKRRMPSLSKITSPIRGPPLQLSKSSAAVPVSSQVQVGSVSSKATPSAAVTSSGALSSNPSMTGSGGYRPKGPPKDQEMDEDSDSEPETGKIQMSKSIAEQKLKALVEKRGIKRAVAQPPARVGLSRLAARGDGDVPDWIRVSQPDSQQRRPIPMDGSHVAPISQPLPSAPIPLGPPYNLPRPIPPSTPRTTRRQMLATELSESLRRNLLWERQVSKNNLAAMRRTSSSGVNRLDELGRLQPFTSIAPVVQLHAKGTIPLDQQEDPAKRFALPVTEAEREEMRRHAVARNRSWANEFHYAGW